MKKDILILSDALLEPPSESYAIRWVTMITHEDLKMNVIVHTTQDLKDLYYKWMKNLGLMDYVDDFLNELEFEDGIRIDTVGFYPNTIVIKYIILENQQFIINSIENLIET